MKKTILFIAGLTLVQPVLAQSLFGNKNKPSVFSYNYVEGHYVNVDDINASGIALAASYDIDANLALQGGFLTASGDQTDIDMFDIGAAYHQKLQGTERDATDLIFHGSFEMADIDAGNHRWRKDHDYSDNGLRFGAGLRSRLVENVEILGDIAWTTARNDQLLFTVGGGYQFDKRLQGQVKLEISDEDILKIGVRYYLD